MKAGSKEQADSTRLGNPTILPSYHLGYARGKSFTDQYSILTLTAASYNEAER